MPQTHRYEAQVRWQGSTAAGYRGYDRTHRVSTPPANHDLTVSADPSFRGDPTVVNPEQLLLAAASSCQLLSFLALAAQAGVDVVDYRDDAEAEMPVTSGPMRITLVTLRPRILVAPGTDVGRVHDLVGRAHDTCYIANTLTAELHVEPTIGHSVEVL